MMMSLLPSSFSLKTLLSPWRARGSLFVAKISLPSGSRKRVKKRAAILQNLEARALCYRTLADLGIDESNCHAHLVPSPLQEKFNTVKALDGISNLVMASYKAPKIRLLRSLSIEGDDGMHIYINRQPCK